MMNLDEAILHAEEFDTSCEGRDICCACYAHREVEEAS
jgi:hypothetical protein